MKNFNPQITWRRPDGARVIILIDPKPGQGLLDVDETLKHIERVLGPETGRKP